MPKFNEIGQKFLKIDTNRVGANVFKKSNVIKLILKTITGRLFKDGIAGNMTKLKTDESIGADFYASFTIRLKNEDGDPVDRVTLKDTGEFYNSFHIFAQQLYFEITADFDKEDGNIYDNFTFLFANEEEFIDAVTSLTPDEFANLLYKEVFDDVLREFKKQFAA